MQCVLRYGNFVDFRWGDAATSCGSEYEMVGCSGYSQDDSLESVYITHNDICYAESSLLTAYVTAIWYVFICVLSCFFFVSENFFFL